MIKNKKYQKRPTVEQLNNYIYGPLGLADQVNDKVRELTAKKVAENMGIDPKTVHGFLNADNPKFSTLEKYAEAVGMK